MVSLQNLIIACQKDKGQLIQQAITQCEKWERWLMPVSVHYPTGEDPAYQDDFQRIREELNKLTGTDAGLICTLAEKLLTGVSKDLRVATFYVWGRLHQEGEAGLAEGLTLLASLLQRFTVQLHPQRERSRKAALEWLCSDRILNSLTLHSDANLATLQRITGALLLIEQVMQSLPPEERPQFSALYQALESRQLPRGSLSNPVSDAAKEAQSSTALADFTPVASTVDSAGALLNQVRMLAKYLQEQQDGWLAAHHLVKSVRWDTLTSLPRLNASELTHILPPKIEHRAHLKRLYLERNWAELLVQADSFFAQGRNHLWLDVQWYLWQALIGMDNNRVRADIICRDMKGLLTRLPGLEERLFNDGSPFADEVTQHWIHEHVLNDMPLWKDEPAMAALPAADEILGLEPEMLAMADSDGIEAALGWLQSRPGMTSPRHQWLMRLLMARVAEQHGKHEMALHLLGDLDTAAHSLTLYHWTPDLIFEIKARRLKLLRLKASRNDAEKIHLQPEMDTLLAGLIALDPARAAILCG